MGDLNYRRIDVASALSGLSEIKLHQLRIAGIVRTRIERNGAGKRIPLYNMGDIEKWMETNVERER